MQILMISSTSDNNMEPTRINCWKNTFN